MFTAKLAGAFERVVNGVFVVCHMHSRLGFDVSRKELGRSDFRQNRQTKSILFLPDPLRLG